MLVIVGLLAVGILWVYTSLIAGPLLREVRGLGQRVRDARQELRVLEAATANEAALWAQHRQLQEDVAALRDFLPDEEELPQLIEQRVLAGEVVLLFRVDQSVDQALGELLLHDVVGGLCGGELAELIEQRVPAGEVVLFFRVGEGVE